MLYRTFIIIFFFSLVTGQSLFNRWIGTDSFTGSAPSTAMGNTHLLNSIGSHNARFNPAKLAVTPGKSLNFQVNRSSVLERWSMPVRDSFDEFLTSADYVANEFSVANIQGGVSYSMNIPKVILI